MALNVFGSSQQYLGVVVELPETQIAGVQRNPAESFEYHADRYYKRYAPREVA